MTLLAEITFYLVALGTMCHVFIVLLRRSEYGVLITITDIGFLLGAIVYPVLLYLNAITPGEEGEAYLARNGMPGLAVAAHVLLYASGCAMGLYLGRSSTLISPNAVMKFSKRVASDYRTWERLLLVGAAVWILYFWLVGFETAIINAVLGRGGEFEGFGEGRQYLFLKTLAGMALYAVCAIPAAFQTSANRRLILLFFVSVLVWFVNSISRNAVLFYVITPLLMHAYVLREKSSMKTVSLVLVAAGLGLLVLLFGKSLGGMISIYVRDADVVDLEAFQHSGNIFETYLRNLEYQWFSIAAGIENFLKEDTPIFPTDVLLSAIGFLPTWMFELTGLQDLDYRATQVSLTCTNTEWFSSSLGCSIPPFWVGFSAYTLPLGGGLVFGFLRYFLFGILERLWIQLGRINIYYTWVIYFVTLTATSFMSMIPSVIAQATIAVTVACAVYIWSGIFSRRPVVAAPV